MLVRKARLEEANQLAPLIYSAGPEIYQFLYDFKHYSAIEFIEFEFRSGQGFCGYPNVSVVEFDGQAVATGCFYTRKDYARLTRETLMNMMRYFGLRHIVPALLKSRHISSVMKKPHHEEVYLSNFGVEPTLRSKGLGSFLIKQSSREYANQGYSIMGLDVADNNPRAEALYKKLGFLPIEEKTFSGKHKTVTVPNALKMECMMVDCGVA